MRCLPALTLALIPAFAPAPAAAAETARGLGLSSLALEAYVAPEGAGDVDLRATVDVAVTEVHGFQGDLLVHAADPGAVGLVAGHLYMQPDGRAKYGLFGFFADMDGHGLFYGGGGAEARIALGESAAVELRGGLGLSDHDGLDFVFFGTGGTVDLAPDLRLRAALGLTEIDEADMAGWAHSAELDIDWRLGPRGLTASAGIVHDSAGDGSGSDLRLRVGLSLVFGADPAPVARPFRLLDPLHPLTRRGRL